jgi:hypothetical protein
MFSWLRTVLEREEEPGTHAVLYDWLSVINPPKRFYLEGFSLLKNLSCVSLIFAQPISRHGKLSAYVSIPR